MEILPETVPITIENIPLRAKELSDNARRAVIAMIMNGPTVSREFPES